eukprot:7387977-Lingulodinium_polyedra.AAC.1
MSSSASCRDSYSLASQYDGSEEASGQISFKNLMMLEKRQWIGRVCTARTSGSNADPPALVNKHVANK